VLVVFGALALVLSGVVFVGILACLEIGRRLGLRYWERNPDTEHSGMGTVEGSVFGLLGLLIAFTFSSALGRWDETRGRVVTETNAIGTAWLRIDLLPAEAQPALRELFRRYLDARIAGYAAMPDMAAADRELARANAMQGDIWSAGVAACRGDDPSRTRVLFLPALNDMFDITTTRAVGLHAHPPFVVYALLLAVLFAASLIAGFATAESRMRSWVHTLCFAAAMSVCVYVILDLEYPRAGLFRVTRTDQIMVDLRASMH